MKLQWHSEHHITQQCKPELGRVSLFPQPSNVFFVCVVQTCNPGVIFNEKTERMLEIGPQYSGRNNHQNRHNGDQLGLRSNRLFAQRNWVGLLSKMRQRFNQVSRKKINKMPFAPKLRPMESPTALSTDAGVFFS